MKKMNRMAFLMVLAFSGSLAGTASAQSGGPFQIEKSVIAGGGGASSGGAFSVQSTIGQPVAGGMIGNDPFSLSSGFWTPEMVGQTAAISGTVIYGTTPVGQSAKFVPGVLLTAAGSVLVNASTDALGAYVLGGLGTGAYTVTPTKSGNVNGISALDAALVAQHAAGLIVLTPNQQLAGDATNNGTLSALDAARIAQTTAGITNSGIAGQWKFVPASRNYASVPNFLSNENYEAILVGDVTGNWTPPPAPGTTVDGELAISNVVNPTPSEKPVQNRSGKADVVDVHLPGNVSAPTGTFLTLPISIGNTTRRGIVAYEFTLEFDPNVLSPTLDPASTTGTLSEAWSVAVNSRIPGKVTVTAYSTQELLGAGILLNLNFSVIGAGSATTPLKWTRVEINENAILLMQLNGSSGTIDSFNKVIK